MQVVSKPFAAVLSYAKVKPAPIWFLAMACMANVSFAQQLKVVEEERTIVVTQADKVVVTYNKVSPPAPTGIDPIYERSGCLHPVGSPQGKFVTAMFPFDHAHQQGIFSAWVNTTYDGRAVDFWNLAGRTGRVLHERVISTFQRAQVQWRGLKHSGGSGTRQEFRFLQQKQQRRKS